MQEPKLSVIMAHLNEGDEPLTTARSALETSPPGFIEVLAVDDCSEKSVSLDGIAGVRASRNKQRMGLFATKDWAVSQARADKLMIIDAHMRFKQDHWAEKIVESLSEEPDTLFCTVCLGLGWKGGKVKGEPRIAPDINRPNGRYHGGTIIIRGYRDGKRGGKTLHWLEPKWQGKQSNDTTYELPSVLGANYGVTKAWWNRIGGLRGLKAWGGQEACLSLKTWLSGGKCKLRTDIEIGHIFRSAAPYPASHMAIWHNRMRMALTLLPEARGRQIHDEIGTRYPAAAKMIRDDIGAVCSERGTFMSVYQPGSLEALAEKFDLQMEWG